MARAAAIVIILIAGWLFLGAPGSLIPPQPQTLGEEPQAFAQNREDGMVLRRADKAGLLVQDPERRSQRVAVLNAYQRLKRSPCDKHARRAYADALKPFLTIGPDGVQLASETVEIDGKRYNATGYLDSAAKDTMFEALMHGYLRPEELPGAMGMQFAVAKRFLGKDSAGFGMMGARCGDKG